MPMSTIEQLAASIDGVPLSWQRDGNTLLAILVETELSLPGVRSTDPEELRDYLHLTLVLLDRGRGWDMPRISQATEEQFYGAFVGLYMTEYGLDLARKAHAEVLKRL